MPTFFFSFSPAERTPLFLYGSGGRRPRISAATWPTFWRSMPLMVNFVCFGSTVTVDQKQTKLTVSGIDRQKVGQVAAEMRGLRPPDPYKNKGVRYVGERLKKKVGKTGAK